MKANYDAELAPNVLGPVVRKSASSAERVGVRTADARMDDREARREEEARWITRVLTGDAEAYRPLVERYHRSVFLLATRLLNGDKAEAEDLTQDSMLRAYQYLASLSDRRRFGPWLYQVARSLCRDRLRRKDSERRALEHRVQQMRRDAIPERDYLGSALSRLPPREFRVLHMRYFEGRTYEEIAEHMDLTFSKVDHLVRRARASLAKIMKREKS